MNVLQFERRNSKEQAADGAPTSTLCLHEISQCCPSKFWISLNNPPTRKHDEIFDVDSRRSNTYRICTGEGDSLEL